MSSAEMVMDNQYTLSSDTVDVVYSYLYYGSLLYIAFYILLATSGVNGACS